MIEDVAGQRVVYGNPIEELVRCDFGEEHFVRWVEKRILYPTGETHSYNNGYETRTDHVYRDLAGRKYYKFIGIDYHNNVHYVCDEFSQKSAWYPHLQYSWRERT